MSERVISQTDPRALAALIEILILRSGVSATELARRMGIRPQSLHQYTAMKRANPSIKWLVRLAEACGARIVVEFGK